MAASLKAASERVVGFMDIGTNSIRLIVVRFHPNHTYKVLTSQREVVRLGQGEFAAQRIQPEAMARTLKVAGRLANMARSFGASNVLAVATSATREARNKARLSQKLRSEAGIDVRVISGIEEARLIYLGVASGMNLMGRRALLVDIGGGSTELIVGDQHEHFYLDSLKLGAIRLANLFIPADHRGPVPAMLYQRIKAHIRDKAIRSVQHLRRHPFDLAIGSSGTLMNLAQIAARRARRSTRGELFITRREVSDVLAALCALPLCRRREVPGINPERADIIIPGGAIIETLMEDLGIQTLRISERSLRDGLPLDYLSREEYAEHPAARLPLRERSVLQLGQACRFDEPHARKVTQLALDLFDSARQSGLHTMGNWQRELLEAAAMLHDIGTFLSFAAHRSHSYYFIRNADLLGFDQTEIAIIAATALYHRSKLPKLKDPPFAELDKTSRQTVRLLCILLRLAESMDRGHCDAIDTAALTPDGRKAAKLHIHARQDCQLELWDLQNHVKAFKKIFGRDLAIAVTPEA